MGLIFAAGPQEKVNVGVHRSQVTAHPVNSPEEDACLNKLADLINGGGGDATVVADVAAAKFAKNIW